MVCSVYYLIGYVLVYIPVCNVFCILPGMVCSRLYPGMVCSRLYPGMVCSVYIPVSRSVSDLGQVGGERCKSHTKINIPSSAADRYRGEAGTHFYTANSTPQLSNFTPRHRSQTQHIPHTHLTHTIHTPHYPYSLTYK